MPRSWDVLEGYLVAGRKRILVSQRDWGTYRIVDFRRRGYG